MPEYTVRNPATQQTVTFRWNAAEPPTDADLDGIFAEAAPAKRQPDFKTHAAIPDGTLMANIGERLAATQQVGPMIGATVGSLAGGTPGAALGGAAGTGYQQLYQHAKELPGAVLDVASNLIHQPKATLGGFAEGAMSGAADAGLSAGVNAGLNAGADLAMRGIGTTGKAIYRGYLKPSLRASKLAVASEVVDTAIREGIPITNAGLKRVSVLKGQLRAEVDAALNASKGEVDLHTIAERVRAFAKREYYRPGVPTGDYEAAMKVADTIDAHPSLGMPPGQIGPAPAPRVSASEANVVKQDIGNAVGDNQFGVPGSKAATRTGKYAYAKTRQAIEAVAPEVAAPNARTGKLIDLASALKSAVERESNQYTLTGTKSMVSAVVGGEEYQRTKDPYAAAVKALGARLLLTPAVMSRIAIVAARLGERSGIAPLAAARLAAGAYGYSETQEQPQGGP